MFDRDKWQEIFGTMRKNKLRTGLTAFGVFWGIFMLIFILGMGAGLKNGVYLNFDQQAKNLMYVSPRPTSMPYMGFNAGRRPRFTIDDIYALQKNIPELDKIAPRLSINGPIRYKGEGDDWEIRGELTDMINMEALRLYEGRYINPIDVEDARKVAVIGKRIRQVLFGGEDPIGKYIQIRGIEFRVVGVFGPIQEKPWRESDLESVVIPLPTMYNSFATGRRIDYFVCSPIEDTPVSVLEQDVRSLLKKRHHIAPDDPRGVGGWNLEQEFNEIKNLFIGINSFLWFVGIGTLIAGIVGVSNIMLIVVKERTREIGIRKAMGATPGSIISMILTESVFITAVSGYLGMLVSTLIIWGVNSLMVANNLQTQNFANPEVNLSVGIGAIVVLIVAGTLAGLIPALQAARVNPVNALKDE